MEAVFYAALTGATVDTMDMVEPSRGSILVVEDDRAIQDAVQDLLREEGYAVIGVTTGQDTLVAVQRRLVRTDLVYLDVWMEEPDSGWRVLKALQADPVTACIPVIVTSAHEVMLTEILPNFPQPHYRFLKKPYDLSTLLGTIRELLDGAP